MLLPSPSSMRAAATTPAEPAGARVARFPANVSLPRDAGGSASASPVSRPARRSLALRPAWSLNRPTRPVTSECFSRSRYLLQPPRLLPAGATVAGRDSHPLGNGALPRRTATTRVAPTEIIAVRAGDDGAAAAPPGRREGAGAPGDIDPPVGAPLVGTLTPEQARNMGGQPQGLPLQKLPRFVPAMTARRRRLQAAAKGGRARPRRPACRGAPCGRPDPRTGAEYGRATTRVAPTEIIAVRAGDDGATAARPGRREGGAAPGHIDPPVGAPAPEVRGRPALMPHRPNL